MNAIKRHLFLVCLATPLGCAGQNYTYFLVRPAPKKSRPLINEGALARPYRYGETSTMKVRWNDGNVVTEIEIPVLESGQRIVVEHSALDDDAKTIPATRVVPPPPSAADDTLVEAYRKRGLPVNDEAPEVSLVRARELLRGAIQSGNYALALQWCEVVLDRYRSHPEFLRAKASVLLLMGEREMAIETYERAEEIESNPEVRKKLEELLREGE